MYVFSVQESNLELVIYSAYRPTHVAQVSRKFINIYFFNKNPANLEKAVSIIIYDQNLIKRVHFYNGNIVHV